MSRTADPITNVLLVGIGGQGILKASQVLADTVFRAGYDVKQSEIHGMAQRMGSVKSEVRFGERVFSPLIPAGEVDILFALQAEEGERSKPLLRPGGMLVGCTKKLTSGVRNPRSLNIALLGALAGRLSLPREHWEAAIEAALPAGTIEQNLAAFAHGLRVSDACVEVVE